MQGSEARGPRVLSWLALKLERQPTWCDARVALTPVLLTCLKGHGRMKARAREKEVPSGTDVGVLLPFIRITLFFICFINWCSQNVLP